MQGISVLYCDSLMELHAFSTYIVLIEDTPVSVVCQENRWHTTVELPWAGET